MKTLCLVCIILASVICGSASATLILNPTEDAHRLTDRNPPVTNNTTTMNVVNYAWHVQTFMKFDLSQVSDLNEVTSMTLRLYETTNGQSGANNGQKNEVIDLYFTNDHSWSETYYEAPTFPTHTGQRIDQVSHTAGPNNWLEWDMSNYDLLNNSVDDTLTLILLSNDTSSGWNMTTFISKDNEQSEFWPQLVLGGNVTIIPEPSSFLLALCLLPLVRTRRQ